MREINHLILPCSIVSLCIRNSATLPIRIIVHLVHNLSDSHLILIIISGLCSVILCIEEASIEINRFGKAFPGDLLATSSNHLVGSWHLHRQVGVFLMVILLLLFDVLCFNLLRISHLQLLIEVV